jgi:hypothetical protein
MAIDKIPSAGIDAGGVAPSNLSTGAPSWDSSGNLSFNSGYGSTAVAYGCRAWVNFNGTGTVAIRASGNVSSITDLGTGIYRANFTNSMPDANYVPLSWDHNYGAGWYDVINASYLDFRRVNNSFSPVDVAQIVLAVLR